MGLKIIMMFMAVFFFLMLYATYRALLTEDYVDAGIIMGAFLLCIMMFIRSYMKAH